MPWSSRRRRTLFALVGGTLFFGLAALASAAPAAAQEPDFGRAVAITDSDLIIGQPVNWYGPGAVYTYRLDASGGWDEQMMLTASDSSRMDDFGRALAHDGNTLVVGAPREPTMGRGRCRA